MTTTCDFTSIKDPLVEAMRTCFLCAINNEAVLKAAAKEDELTFRNVVQITSEVEKAAKTAKPQIYAKLEKIHEITKPRILHSNRNGCHSLLRQLSTNHVEAAGNKITPETNAVSAQQNAITARRKATLKPHATANKLGRSDFYHKRERYTTNTYPDHSTGKTPPVFDQHWRQNQFPVTTTAEYRSASGHSIPILGTASVD